MAAAPVLTYGCQTWVLRKQDTRRIQTAANKFLRRLKGRSLCDQIRNEDVRAELGMYTMDDRIRQCSLQWKQCIQRMSDNCLIKQVGNYRSQRRRDLVGPEEDGRTEDGTGCKPRP